MRRDKIEIYIHIIWTVYDRHPLITPKLEEDLFPIICDIGDRHKVKTLGINGTTDHVHWLTKFSSTTRLCDLVKDAKGASSLFANDVLGNFKWRPTYAAFSVSRWNTRQIAEYIARQKEHHANGTTRARLESDDEEYKILDGE
jgi:REP element-mobilizing transposase RayT